MNDWSVSFYQRTKSSEEKFWEKVDRKSDDECWNWLAAKNRKGYGGFYISQGHSKDRFVFAHRYSWFLCYGEIPQGLQVLHHCDNPSCVNPKHLFLGTNNDNVKDKIQKGRQHGLCGSKNPCSKLSENDVILIRTSFDRGIARQVELSKYFGVTGSLICSIINRKSWTHI